MQHHSGMYRLLVVSAGYVSGLYLLPFPFLQQRLKQKWTNLVTMSEQRKENLDNAQEIHKFHR